MAAPVPDWMVSREPTRFPARSRGLVSEEWSSWESQKGFGVAPLVSILEATIHDGERAVIRDASFLRAMGESGSACTAGQLWMHLIRRGRELDEFRPMLHAMMEKGSLARRLLRAVGMNPSHAELMEEYSELCDCCREGRLFDRQPRLTYL